MYKLFFSLITILSGLFLASSHLIAETITAKTFFELSANSALGSKVNFSDYRGHVILVANISTRCGTTPQLKDLESLYQKYKARKFVVLGFPSEDFAPMQFDSNAKVQRFCAQKYGITFPIFETAHVKGEKIQPVFKFLTYSCSEQLKAEVSFNLEKFLVGRDGQVKQRYGSFTGPLATRVIEDIEAELSR